MKLTLIEKDRTLLTCSVNPRGITGDCYEYPKGSAEGIPVAVSLLDLIERSREAEEVEIMFPSKYGERKMEIVELLEGLLALKRKGWYK